jgi:hypothetical protein
VSLLNRALEELRVEKARSFQGEIDELKTTLAEESKEVNRLKGELSVKANEITTLECNIVKLNEENESRSFGQIELFAE